MRSVDLTQLEVVLTGVILKGVSEEVEADLLKAIEMIKSERNNLDAIKRNLYEAVKNI